MGWVWRAKRRIRGTGDGKDGWNGERMKEKEGKEWKKRRGMGKRDKVRGIQRKEE